jgi:hypothetical protein
VKGFDAARQVPPVPGFGNGAQVVAGADVRRTQPRHGAGAQTVSATEARQQTATSPKAPPARRSFHFRSVYELPSFPSGVPEWFKHRDTDFDGQVFMWEYATSWTDDAAQTFVRLDLNGDGVITAHESVSRREPAAEVRRAVSASPRGSDGAPSVAAAARLADPARAPAAGSAVNEEAQAVVEAPAQSLPARSAAPHAIPQAFVSYADGVIKRFDADRDGVLTSGEWAAMPAAASTADADGDEQITVNELAVWYVLKR